MKHLHVWYSKSRKPSPDVIETNITFALPYWENRKAVNENIRWKIVEVI
jgi:hypothetical protein